MGTHSIVGQGRQDRQQAHQRPRGDGCEQAVLPIRVQVRRCLVAADGFYEWRKTKEGKRPLYIRLKDHEPFAFAGLWERWWAEDGKPVESCTIITTEPNELMASLHNRMPVILASESYSTWLGSAASGDTLQGLLRPFPADQMEAYRVSTMVNSPLNQGERLIERIEDEPAIERVPERRPQTERGEPTLFEV
jgi:putative SOS response-associated peptidase YedK